MAGSTFGTILRMTTWGESHGPALGVTVDGCPAGLELCEADVQEYLDRRSRAGKIFHQEKRGRSGGDPVWSV